MTQYLSFEAIALLLGQAQLSPESSSYNIAFLANVLVIALFRRLMWPKRRARRTLFGGSALVAFVLLPALGFVLASRAIPHPVFTGAAILSGWVCGWFVGSVSRPWRIVARAAGPLIISVSVAFFGGRFPFDELNLWALQFPAGYVLGTLSWYGLVLMGRRLFKEIGSAIRRKRRGSSRSIVG